MADKAKPEVLEIIRAIVETRRRLRRMRKDRERERDADPDPKQPSDPDLRDKP